MKELALVHELNVNGRPMSKFREPAHSWELQPDGAYLVRVEGLPGEEYRVPSTGVKYERRMRKAAAK